MDELGDGDGDGDLLDGEGDGLDELGAGDDDELPDDFPVSEVLGVDDGLALVLWLDEGEALGEADLLLLADPEADADPLGLWPRGVMVAAVSTAPFGGDEHAA